MRELPSGSFQVIVYAGTDPLTKKPRYIRETFKRFGQLEAAVRGPGSRRLGAIFASIGSRSEIHP